MLFQILKKIKKTFFKIIKYFLLLLSIYFSTALILSLIPAFPTKINCELKKEIYLSTNGVHLDIIIPKKYLSEKLIDGLIFHDRAEYIAFGWGDKGFYLDTPTWADLTFSTAVSAMFLKGESAMHVTAYFKKYNNWKKMELCPSQLNDLMAYINASFKKDNLNRKKIIPQKGYSRYDEFYEGVGSYSIFKTCNIWVNKALKKAEVKTALWSPFDKGILFHIN